MSRAVLLLVAMFLLASPVSALITKNYDPASQTLWINNSGIPIVEIHQVSTISDLTYFQEVLEVTPSLSYTLTSEDMNRIFTKYKGTNGISSSTIEILTNGAWKPFNIVGFNIVSGTTYTLRITFYKRAELGDVSILTGFTFWGVNINELTWFNSSWLNRNPILINNTGNATTLTNFTVNLNLSYIADMNANFSDIRVVNETSGTTLPYWIESQVNGSYANIWFNATNIPASVWTNSTYYLYYNNPSASSASNGSTTFLQFHGYSNIDYKENNIVSIPFIYQAQARVLSASGEQTQYGISDGTADTPTNSIFVFSYDQGGANSYFWKTSSAGVPSSSSTTPKWGQNTWKNVVITANSTSVRFNVSGYSVKEINTNIPTVALGLWAKNVLGTSEQNYSFLRKYALPDPSAQMGTQETCPFYISGWQNNFTNDQQLTISYTSNQIIRFNASTSTLTTSYGWELDGVNQSTAYDNYSVSLPVGAHTISATFYNSTLGFWANKTWYMTLQMVLTSPANNSIIYYNYPPQTSGINHTWTTAGYPYYEIQISSDVFFNSLIADTFTSNPYYSQSITNGLRYWRVRNYDSSTLTYGAWTPTFSYLLVANMTSSGKAGIQGVIYEYVNSITTPLSGATVYISNVTGTWSSSVVTGANGYYVFDNLTNATTYNVYASKQNYLTSPIEYVTTGNGVWSTKDIQLKRCISGFECGLSSQYVKFIVQNIWGTKYSGVLATVYTGSDVVSSNSGTTGSDGAVTFFMIKDQSYRMTFVNSTQGINHQVILTPSEPVYYIIVSQSAPVWGDDVSESEAVQVSVISALVGTTGHINATYNNSVAGTTSLIFYLNQTNKTNGSAPQVNIQTINAGAVGNYSANFTGIANAGNKDYVVNVIASHSVYGSIYRSFGVRFEGLPSTALDFIPSALKVLFAISIIIFTAALAGHSSRAQISGLVVILAWVFIGIGWFNYFDTRGIIAGTSLATVVSVLWNINERQTQEQI